MKETNGPAEPLHYPPQYSEMIPGGYGFFHIGENNEEQSDPLGTLSDFLDKEKFDTRFNHTMEVQVNEERLATGYTKEVPKDTTKTNKRRCIFIIITETQAIQEKISYTNSKRSNIANASAVILYWLE